MINNNILAIDKSLSIVFGNSDEEMTEINNDFIDSYTVTSQ